MSVNDATGAPCADIFYKTSTSEHTSNSSILASPDVGPPTRSRKRKRNEANWKDSKRKRALNLGGAYVNRKNRQIPRKTMKAGCDEKYRMKCQDRNGKEHRETVFQYFGDIDKRRDYVCTDVEELSKKASGVPSRRLKSLKYHLEIVGLKQAICKTVFLGILGISEQLPLRKRWVWPYSS